MSEIQHPSLKAELLYLIGRASAPLSCAELYEKCELADEVAKVAKALNNLQSDKKIVPIKGEGGTRYKLADGVAAPAPAGKVGRPHIADPDAKPVVPAAASVTQHVALKPKTKAAPMLETPTLGATPGPEDRKAADEAIAKGLDLVEEQLKAERLADAIIARLKTDLGPMLRPYIGESIEAENAAVGPSVHIHIEQIDIHLGGL